MKHRIATWILMVLTAVLALGAGPALAQMPSWEKELYEAAKKEKDFTVYTAHYDTETIADICAAFDRKYPGVKCNFVRTTAQVAYVSALTGHRESHAFINHPQRRRAHLAGWVVRAPRHHGELRLRPNRARRPQWGWQVDATSADRRG